MAILADVANNTYTNTKNFPPVSNFSLHSLKYSKFAQVLPFPASMDQQLYGNDFNDRLQYGIRDIQGTIGNKLIDIVFIEGTMNGVTFDNLKDLSGLLQDLREITWLQNYCCLPLTPQLSKKNFNFSGQRIGRGGPVNWSTRTPYYHINMKNCHKKLSEVRIIYF